MTVVVVVVLVMFEVYNNLVNLLASLQKVNTAPDAESLLVPFSLLKYSNTHGQGARRPEWPRRNLHICPIKSSRAKDNGRYPQQNG